MWNTRRWLLRSLLLTVAVSGLFLSFQFKAKKQAEIRYQQNLEYSKNMETKKIKKGNKKQTSASSLVAAKKPEFTPWYIVDGIVAALAIPLSAMVQKWGWSPILTTLFIIYITIIGIVLIFT